ncbi:RnfABCDGE type electron transport complex subunit D [Christensenella timonensis]|uniref:RnfABCDGE type electron transport complex subunit D n=1 Tax=Christensenella timonensis TaxID=1816678 RepID=UPI000833C4C5|nr:RnfABCDGE type electron transport complex subunit D [Christensenella timonensis]
MQQELILSGSPHIKSGLSTSRIMLDVIIALIPACIAAVYFFGAGCIATIALCILSAVGCEAAIQYFTKRAVTISDLSAVVTGLLLALNLPPNVPWYIPVCGSAFAIIIVKQCFGGLGHNFMNPALAARCFLLISWPVAMTTFVAPFAGVDAVASATPLGVLHEGGTAIPPLMDMFLGKIGGSMGETSALALLIGGIYLLARRVISLRIPLSFMGTVALITLLTGHPEMILFELFAGGLMLGAFFMATDYVSSPSSPKAQIIFGIGCGAITMIVRLWGGYPEGVSFSILFMNLLTPLLDKVLKPKTFGEVQKVNE